MRVIFAISMVMLLLSVQKGSAQFKNAKGVTVSVEYYWEKGVVLGTDAIRLSIMSLDYLEEKKIYQVTGMIPLFYSRDVIDSSELTRSLFSIKNPAGAVIRKQSPDRYGLFTLYLKKGECAEVGEVLITKLKIVDSR